MSQREITYVDREILQENIDITKNRLNTKQPSVLNTPIDVLGNEEITVEDALQAINDKEEIISWADYQALSYEEKHSGKSYYVYDAGDILNNGKEILNGYLNSEDGKFYQESTYVNEINPSIDCLFVDNSEDVIYRWNSSEQEFVKINHNTDDSVEQINNKINANSGGIYIDITSHGLQDPYIAPSDGYVTLQSGTVSSGIIYVTVLGANNILVAYLKEQMVMAYQSKSLYVKKGMKINVVECETGMNVIFNPII